MKIPVSFDEEDESYNYELLDLVYNSDLEGMVSSCVIHDYTMKSNDGTNLLMYSIIHECDKPIIAYISRYVDINHRDSYGRTALIYSFYFKEEVVNLLLKSFAYINCVDNAGNTALMHAIIADVTIKTFKTLLLLRYNIKHKNNKGETALDLIHKIRDGKNRTDKLRLYRKFYPF